MDTIKIIDIHNHSLPLVDDGPDSFGGAVENIEYLVSHGVKDIILTSHYIKDSNYDKSISNRVEVLTELKSRLQGLPVNLYLGNEVFISDAKALKELLDKEEITTLNNSRYLLIEFPIRQKLNYIESTICELNEMGYVPIIAHPERYTYIQDNFDNIYNLLEYDCLLQCNILSYMGHYGSKAKKTIKRLLKENLVTFLATDLHHVPKKDELTKTLNKLEKKIGSQELKKLVYDNPFAVLNNEVIDNL